MKSVFLNKKIVSGTFLITLCIIFSKILDILYVIPLHSILNNESGALYGYVYTIYLLFVSLATFSIPLVISNIVFEYQKQGFYSAKRRVLFLGRKLAFFLGVIISLLLVIFAPIISSSILGNVNCNISVYDITFVIRILAICLLISPVLSIYQGYFEGHRLSNYSSLSKAIEKIVMIFCILLFSYLCFNTFKMTLSNSLALVIFGIFLGTLISLGYLVFKKYKSRQIFEEKVRSVNEPLISNKSIVKKIMVYSIPFILIDISKGLYNYVDINTVLPGLVNYANFSVDDALEISGILSIWSFKFNMLIFSISTGVIVSLVPSLRQSIDKKDKNCSKKINQAFEMLLFLIVPVTCIISFLAKPIWLLFYGSSNYGPSILTYYVFVGLFSGLLFITISIIQIYKDYKTIIISILSGLVLKILLNNNLIVAFYKMGVPAYYGIITASILGYLLSFVIAIIMLSKKFEINYEDLAKHFIDILLGSMLMTFILFILKMIIPIYSDVRIMNLFIIVLYCLIGFVVYLAFMRKNGSTKYIFGDKGIRIKKK